MSRTFPRALGVNPANWVSLKVFMTGEEDTDHNPSTQFAHSSARERRRQGGTRDSPVQICRKKRGRTERALFQIENAQLSLSRCSPRLLRLFRSFVTFPTHADDF